MQKCVKIALSALITCHVCVVLSPVGARGALMWGPADKSGNSLAPPKRGGGASVSEQQTPPTISPTSRPNRSFIHSDTARSAPEGRRHQSNRRRPHVESNLGPDMNNFASCPPWTAESLGRHISEVARQWSKLTQSWLEFGRNGSKVANNWQASANIGLNLAAVGLI